MPCCVSSAGAQTTHAPGPCRVAVYKSRLASLRARADAAPAARKRGLPVPAGRRRSAPLAKTVCNSSSMSSRLHAPSPPARANAAPAARKPYRQRPRASPLCGVRFAPSVFAAARARQGSARAQTADCPGLRRSAVVPKTVYDSSPRGRALARALTPRRAAILPARLAPQRAQRARAQRASADRQRPRGVAALRQSRKRFTIRAQCLRNCAPSTRADGATAACKRGLPCQRPRASPLSGVHKWFAACVFAAARSPTPRASADRRSPLCSCC